MTLSRTARILVAILLLAAAAFFWVNFLYRDGVAPVNVEGPPVLGADGAQVASPEGGATTATADAPDGAAEDGATTVQGVPADPGDGTVVIPTPEVVTRDVDIADLPFLITEPPAAPADAEAVESEAAAIRQQASRRISVNPFSPILIQAQAPAPTAPPTTMPTVTQVEVPAGPAAGSLATSASSSASTRPVTAPAPRPLAPPAPRAGGLPRQLPGGAPLAGTPDLLRETRTVPELTAADLGGMAALREPASSDRAGLMPMGVAHDAVASDVPVEPLGPAARAAEAPAEVREVAGAPLEAGVDALSRYLRDNNVVFTGSVRGPVGVGVFRRAGSQTPLVVSLGQSLPETEIVLTDLTGMKAEFTLADVTHVLSLDLRR